MKNLTLIVHEDMEQALADLLRGIEHVPGFIFTKVEAHGAQDDRDPALSARDRVVGYTPHVRVDLLLSDKDVERVLEALRDSKHGLTGRGDYWISDIVRQGRL